MNVQVLIATMNQNKLDYSLLDQMKITTDAIVSNQTSFNSVEEFTWNDNSIKWFNISEVGVGLNRNNALMRASSDICLFADDDIVYCDNYESVIINAFKKYPKADVIIFNLRENKPSRYIIKKNTRVRFYNYMRYGTARIAIKLEPVKLNGIMFNLCFGGGTNHRHGEDTLFLTECLKKGLKIYAVSDYIGELKDDRESTWNVGYDTKYIQDQGVLYHTISRLFWKPLCFQDAIRRHDAYNTSIYKAYKLMIK